jgi:hypothetical protein
MTHETKKLATEYYDGHLTVLLIRIDGGRTERIELLSDEPLGLEVRKG